MPPDGPVEPSPFQPYDPGLVSWVAVLEEIAKAMKDGLARLEAGQHRLDARMEALAEGQTKLREGVAELRGQVKNLPTTWAMLVAIVGGQVALSGLVFAALRFNAALH